MAIPREVGKHIKKLTNTRELREFKQTLHLTTVQKAFLYGTLLGDGCLITSRSGKSARLQVRQNWNYKEYVIWKFSLFKDWVRTHPREDFCNNSFYFRTISHPELMSIKSMFYKGTKRYVPEHIAELLVEPLSLAVWAMDDGNGHKQREYFRLSTYGFEESGNKLLQQCLENVYSLRTTIYRDSKGMYLYFPKVSAYKLHRIVKPYILPCMQYKFASLTP